MTYRALFKFSKLSENAKTEYEKNTARHLWRVFFCIKKEGPPFPADPKEKNIIKLKEMFGNGDIITYFHRQEKPFVL